MGEANCLLLLEWLATASFGLVRLPCLLFCRASLLPALGGCCTNPICLVLTCRLVPVIGRAADLRGCLSRCGRLGRYSCSLALALMGLANVGLSISVPLWLMLGSVALLGDTLCCGTGHRLLPHENHRCCGCHEHVFGTERTFLFFRCKV